MKRIISFVLCAAMLMSCLVFAVGADAAAAQAVMEQINALTKDSSDAQIEAVEDAYYELSPEDQALVTNFNRIQEIRDLKKDPAVEAVIDMLAMLSASSTVEQLSAAIAAYEALTDAQKAEVWNAKKIVDICNQKASDLVKQIDSLPAAELTDVYHHEDIVNGALAIYELLPSESRELVTNSEKLLAIATRFQAFRDWDANKAVNILNSTLNAMSKYTQEDMDNYAQRAAVGMYYEFEEVGYVFRGDPTTGYFGFEEGDNNKVADQKYAKLDFDLKVTDIDILAGWPILLKMTTDDSDSGYIGYDYLNKQFFYSTMTHISHGALEKVYATAPAEFDLGVWHRFTYLFDGDNITITMDGKTVFETTHIGDYSYLIMYPWLCNLEMTNVVYTDKFGVETLSPFRNALNNPTGWSKRGNDRDATMLDLVKESVEAARNMYYGSEADKIPAFTDEQKAQVVGIEVLDKVADMIERVGKNDVVVEGGTASAALAAEGETVTITASEAPEGKEFDKWVVEEGEVTLADETQAKTTFTMGAAAVKIVATYRDAFKPGDANGDGTLNARDITAIMKFMLGNTPKDFNEKAADFNSDGSVNARDITGIMRELLK